MLADLRYRLRALFRRADLERELEQELAFHVDQATGKYVAEGMTTEAARRRALIEFGSLDNTREESRDRRGTALLESILADLRYTLRGLRAHPGFTAGVVVTLALGIGANAAMFGVLDRLFFRAPAFLRDANQVHRIYTTGIIDRQPFTEGDFSIGQFLDLRRTTRSFTSISGFNTWTLAVGDGSEVREYPVAAVSATYFPLFDATPALGRFFTPQEDTLPTGTAVAVLGYAYWQTAFGGRTDILGRTIKVGRTVFTIIGAAPKGFVGIDEDQTPAMYIPLAASIYNQRRDEDHTRDYHWQWMRMVAKRAPGVTVAAGEAELSHAILMSNLGERPDDPNWPQRVAERHQLAVLAPVQLDRGPEAGPEASVIAWIAGVALIVLLIACANVANLLLARALTRRREIALRLALGVSRGRLARQLLTESLVLALLGGGAGLCVAQWGGAVLRSLLLPGWSASEVITDPRTVAAAFLCTLAAALATGLAPVMQAVRHDLSATLGAGARQAGAGHSRMRAALLVFQATLSVVLLTGAGLFVRSLSNVHGLWLGYDVDPVVVLTINRRGVNMTDTTQRALEARLTDAALATPGVVAATPAPAIPFWSFEGRPLFVEGIDTVGVLGDFLLQSGTPDYFRTMGTRILRGRGFDTGDRADAPPVMIVSQGMGKTLWPGQDPLGKCVRIGSATASCSTVVGVAEDLHLYSFSDPKEFSYYVPMAQYPHATSMLLVRVTGDATRQAEPIRRRLQALMPGASYLTALPLRSMVSPRMVSWEIGATMFVAFGALALLLAAVGLYSVIAYGVEQRRREIGVRLALGARQAQVIRLVLNGGLRLVGSGLVLGGVVAIVAGRWVAGLLFNEPAVDPLVFGGVTVVLVLVALAATAIPALNAARVDPNVTLRAD
ncbi:MAG TPA: ADOP family duplicated permease [Gemmatimonadales bacterium]|nr:ADOP family duplicated permease [Gemmatimonadales bacterium]